MGLNEFAGYIAVAGAALATGWIAARYGLRPEPFYLGVVFVARRLALSALLVRETSSHVRAGVDVFIAPSAHAVAHRRGLLAHHVDRSQSVEHQPGRPRQQPERRHGVGPVSAVLRGAEHEPGRIGVLAAIYPATWGVAQLARARCRIASDEVADRERHVDPGRRHRRRHRLGHAFVGFASGAVLLGIGTAMVYPDAARRDRRRGAPVLARVGGRRLSLLARSRLRRRRAARRRLTADASGLRRDVARRRHHVRVRCHRRGAHARNVRLPTA